MNGKDTDNDFIDWMRKELYEMLYQRTIDRKTMWIFIELIAKWRRRNESN